MELKRRTLLKIGGLAILGLSAKPGWQILSAIDQPESSPVPGPLANKKWAMAVDLKRCWTQEECRDCIDICHRVHNVPDMGSLKEEIKWLWLTPYEKVFPEHEFEVTEEEYQHKPVLLLCNHCDDPPCVRYCPTKATWKREDGIVMMDFHRCIGCRFCMAGCPYGSRSFNFRDPEPYIKTMNPEYPHRTRGVVEKCNFCAERVDDGKKPACVESCPSGALTFGDLNDPTSEVRKLIDELPVERRRADLGTEPSVYYIT